MCELLGRGYWRPGRDFVGLVGHGFAGVDTG